MEDGNENSLSKLIDTDNMIGGSPIIYFGYAMGDFQVGEITFYAVLKNNNMGIYKMFMIQ